MPMVVAAKLYMYKCYICIEWCQEYQSRYHDTKLLQEDIDSYMASYDQKVKEVSANQILYINRVS